MNVASISEFRSREIVAVLEHLLRRARRGDVIGLALCTTSGNGPEEILFAGLYRTSPAKAVNASMRMSWRLTQLQDELDASQA